MSTSVTHVSMSEARAQWHALVHRAEAGENIVLTLRGKAVARMVTRKPITAKSPALTPDEKLAVIREIQKQAKGKFEPGFDAARSQDFLYEDDGSPR